MKKRICLCSIVKNESRIIERMLESTLGIVDFYSIVDTGSSDNTTEIINKWFRKNKVKGTIHSHEWKNFGYNRTLSLAAAKESYKQADYLLCVDADMVVVNKSLDKTKLIHDSYLIMQESRTSKYYINRILSTRFTWKSIGVTHEYFAPFDPKNENIKLDNHSQERYDGIEIDDREDGGCKDDKFIRDEKLFIQGMKDEPNNVRYMYYYGQTLECLKKYAKAINMYEKRCISGGYEEERWYAIYRIALCYRSMGHSAKTIEYFLKAYSERQTRAEPIYDLAKYYIEREKIMPVEGSDDKITVPDKEFNDSKKYYNLAYIFLTECSKIKYPEDMLFVDKEAHTYGPNFQLCIICYYLRKYEEGLIAGCKVLKDETTPLHIKNITKGNLKFYYDYFNATIINSPAIINNIKNEKDSEEKDSEEKESEEKESEEKVTEEKVTEEKVTEEKESDEKVTKEKILIE